MAIISTTYQRAGSLHGMQLIAESGLATNDTDLTAYETGRLELVPLPRSAGIVVKVLDGAADPTLLTITADAIVGTVTNLLQLGRTRIQRAFPAQPIGTYSSKEIVGFDRMWVQVSAAEPRTHGRRKTENGRPSCAEAATEGGRKTEDGRREWGVGRER